ncbi:MULTISPECIES: GAF domain-containing sensor histidine kinase [Halorussus]|uniref:sensor histidine kinase n=1 Tax=Halorussus TaxID=1070314 RepID=UPI0013B3C6A8|nr:MULTISPECIES: GAF domain-containing sensor histidine kinase [Halorussus]NHN57625.1 GAF domain-containing protein [Halorussus sp. JP-T4]
MRNSSGLAGSVAVSGLGVGLFLLHAARAVGEDESLATLVFGVLLPMAVSVGVALGGVWLWRSGLAAAGARRVGTWCVVGVAVLGLGAVLIILYQRAHGATMVDRWFVVLDTATGGAFVGFVVGVYDAERRRQRRTIRARERALDELHARTRTLVETSDREAVASQAVEAARDILGFRINTCWLYDGADDVLRPVAQTDDADDLVGETPTYTGDDSLSWEAFRADETMVFDDVREAAGRHSEDTPIRSEIVLPLGEYGVMNVGSTEPGAFDEMDVSLARILAANTQTALERADREQELETARDEAERLNRQLTVLNRVFRHDLRNAANVIEGHADLLVEDATDEAAARSAATIREQAAGLVQTGDQIRDVERLLQNEGEERRVVDIAAVVGTQLDRVRRDYPTVVADGPDCDACRVYAHPLVESAIRNLFDNGVEHNDADEPRIDVTFDCGSEDGVTVRVADNGPGIPDEEVAVLERGYETPLDHASGLGLWLVNWIVRESGGAVSFDERTPRGSVVRLRFERAPPDAAAAADRDAAPSPER